MKVYENKSLHVNIRKNFVANQTLESVLLNIQSLVLFPVLDSLLMSSLVRPSVQLYRIPVPQTELFVRTNISQSFVEDLTGQENMLQVLFLFLSPDKLKPGSKLRSIQEPSDSCTGNQNLKN